MCTIAIKTRGFDIPDEIIKNIFSNNPDGAGIMWVENGKVYWEKGFFTEKALLKAWHKHVKTDTLASLHCRIATHGAVDYQHCHPFALTEDNTMFKRKGSCNAVLMHNGVMSFMEQDHENYNKKIDSDSSAYARKMFRKFGKVARLPNSEESAEFRKETESGNRLVVFSGDGSYWTSGEWEYKDGILYSNGNWKYSYKKYYSSNYPNTYRNHSSLWDNDEYWENYDSYSTPSTPSKETSDTTKKCYYATGTVIYATAGDFGLYPIPSDFCIYVSSSSFKLGSYMRELYDFYIDTDGSGLVYQKIREDKFIECPDLFYDIEESTPVCK